jgi:hypothetical protein
LKEQFRGTQTKADRDLIATEILFIFVTVVIRDLAISRNLFRKSRVDTESHPFSHRRKKQKTIFNLFFQLTNRDTILDTTAPW